MQVTSALSRLS